MGKSVKNIFQALQHIELYVTLLLVLLLIFPNRFSPVAAGILVLLWIYRWACTGRLSRTTPFDLSIVIILGCAGISLGIAPAVDDSLPRFWQILAGIGSYYAIVNHEPAARNLRHVRLAIYAAALGLVCLTVLGTDWGKVRLVESALYRWMPGLIRDLSDGDLFNPRVMGMALAMIAAVPLVYALAGRGKERWLAIAVVIPVMVLVVLTQSLQALLGLACALLCILVWRSRWFLLALPLLLLALGGVALALDPHRLLTAALSMDNPYGIAVILRLDMWSRAWAMIKDMPFTGIGLDSFRIIQMQFYPGVTLGAEPHAHNLFLQLALDLGVPGLLAYIGLFFALACEVRNTRKNSLISEDSLLLLQGCTAGIAAHLGSGIIDAPWSSKPGVLFWLLLAALAVQIPYQHRPFSQWRFRQRHLYWGALGVVLLSAWLLLPNARVRNLALVRAHRVVLQAQSSRLPDLDAMSPVIDDLEQVDANGTGNGTVYRTLGRLYGWTGDFESAVNTLAAGVDDDRLHVLAYTPWLRLRQLAEHTLPAATLDPQNLVDVYKAWQIRYPERAEHYIQAAIVLEREFGDVTDAEAALKSGLAHGTYPEGLLQFAAEQ